MFDVVLFIWIVFWSWRLGVSLAQLFCLSRGDDT